MTSPETPERVAFDSEALPPDERMDRYRALYAIGADVTQVGPNPRATFEAWRLDRALLYDRRLNDISHSRSEQRVGHDGFTHWTVTLVFEGLLQVDFGDGMLDIRAGEIVLIDVSRATRNMMRHARIATLAIAQDRIEETVGPIGALHGRVLAADHCRLYADFVGSLLSNLPTMKTSSLPAATSALCTLLKVALEAYGLHDAVVEGSRDGRRLGQLRTLVDGRLGDPTFDPETAIAESGVSRATLYRMLRPQRGLAAFILARRLEHVRRALSNAAERRSFADIALDAGLVTESHASRAFLARYGLRPGGYRAAIATAIAETDPIEQMRLWQQELR
ncbi:AraC-like DNA-binding protein [Sphingomonas sp. PP-F2F-A104-K0414]|uniref:helix-turn-helix domain-containing protein n=1 Tax=Sphingomonas sp. PP-F2F-A104-K0414 TaxID=2135661 RepID=UPI0010447E04|nr:helix-turn-helix domain-containing protein [Sphingomonas sp. PP-F2F-A104-K0414]TCP98939.1 AraC-like DNA-binding protein [Sphingomonas sp. PP-F2F-A104-K0414]